MLAGIAHLDPLMTKGDQKELLEGLARDGKHGLDARIVRKYIYLRRRDKEAILSQ